jgi:ABC-type branched-subunit amino acid transport system ATPase component
MSGATAAQAHPDQAPQALLTISNLESYYGPIMAIRGCSLEVREGQIATVLGANGAGKTTLMKTISGVMDPEKGQIVYRGENIAGASPDSIVRKGIVHVPEGREVFPLLTVEENLRMGAFTRSESGEVRRDEEMVFSYFPILAERRRQAAGTLSGGQRNRVHLAKLLKDGGNVILLDEPTNDLDTETLAALEDALENFPGCAVIISHDRMFLDRLATHILAFEGDSHVEWFEGNFEDYEADKIRRLGPDSVNPKRVTYKRLTR